MFVVGRVARRRAETRERIFVEAMRLFAERGVDQVTVADITEAADIGKGTFFTYFPSKADVFSYFGEQVIEAMTDAAQKDKALSAPRRLKVAFAAAASWIEAHPQPARQMAVSRTVRPGIDLGSRNQHRLRTLFTDIIVSGQESGDIDRDVDVEQAVIVLSAGYLGCVISWAAESDGTSLRDRLDGMVRIVVHGIRRR